MGFRVLMVAFLSLGVFAACDSARENVAEQQKDLQETKAEAARDVRDAQADLQKAQADMLDQNTTASGSTTGSADMKVTAEQCEKLAMEKPLKPENKAAYEACSKMKKPAAAKK